MSWRDDAADDWRRQFLAQMRSADRIELRLSLGAKRKTSTRDEYFAF
jgi:hypothetical protein